MFVRRLLGVSPGGSGGAAGSHVWVGAPANVVLRLLSQAALLIFLLSGASVSTARAQGAEDEWAPPERMGSAEVDPSLLGGRTLPDGSVLLAAGIGWPGLWVELDAALGRDWTAGVRAAITYGSPIMGFASGASGEFTIPMRIHLYGEDEFDFALRLAPELAIGEGRLIGESDSVIRGDEMGISSRLEIGARLGIRPSDGLSISIGLDAAPGFAATIDTGEDVRAIGLFTGSLGVEFRTSPDTFIFIEVGGGVGVADGSGRDVPYFPEPEILRIFLGMAYLL